MILYSLFLFIVMAKSNLGILVFIVFIVSALVLGVYFLFFDNGYPSSISDFSLLSIDDVSALGYEECFEETLNNVCITGIGSVTYNNDFETDDVVRMKVVSRPDLYKAHLKSYCIDPLFFCSGNIIVDNKSYKNQKLIYWFYEDDKFIEIRQWGNDILVLESPVVKYFMKKYPPIVF